MSLQRNANFLSNEARHQGRVQLPHEVLCDDDWWQVRKTIGIGVIHYIRSHILGNYATGVGINEKESGKCLNVVPLPKCLQEASSAMKRT